MRFISGSLALASVLALLTIPSPARSASYEQLDGTIITSIQLASGGTHPYQGPDLEPYADLSGAALSNADLYLASLADADLGGANLNSADLTGADLFFTNLADASLSNADLTEASLYITTLCSAVLVNTILVDADLTDADLTEAILYNADLRRADLTAALLTDTNLKGANLTEAVLYFANLTGANLSYATLTGTDLTRASNLHSTFWQVEPPRYDEHTDFTHTGFDPVANGWTYVPEPGVPRLLFTGIVAIAIAIGARGRASRARVRRSAERAQPSAHQSER